MISLVIAITLKLLTELLIAVGVAALAVGALWVWDKLSPQSFEKVLEKVARYFK